jgi:hypothetical protein
VPHNIRLGRAIDATVNQSPHIIGQHSLFALIAKNAPKYSGVIRNRDAPIRVFDDAGYG